jgi:hypothetical protein
VLGAVLGRSPRSVRAIGCGEVLELVGDDGFEWVAQRTERAVRQLLAVIRVGEREEVLVSRSVRGRSGSSRPVVVPSTLA